MTMTLGGSMLSEHKIPEPVLQRLQESLDCRSYTSGTTHHFYHYPARFSPQIAREVILSFTRKGSWIFDPFMGGGTSIIESLRLGRKAIGVDINALAQFVANVRTSPISSADADAVREWARTSACQLIGPASALDWVDKPDIRNLPPAVGLFMAGALSLAETMLPRRRAFARCVLLRLGQWVLDCRDFVRPRRLRLAVRLEQLAEEFIHGMADFVSQCNDAGVSKSEIADRRVLLNRSAVGVEAAPELRHLRDRARLVFTSPPYPGVNVLYHRWQYRGRRETPAPYWIANVPDGCGASYYCGGSRTPTGLRNYFAMITDAFRSIMSFVHDDAVVVQLIGFSDAETQLPIYLRCMEAVGLVECQGNHVARGPRLARQVPNRKWYAKLKGPVDASTEYLLIHRRAH